ncbi:phosphatase domain-containing protein [Rosenbergiella nectarea]
MNESWHQYVAQCGNDVPLAPAIEMFRAIDSVHYAIIITSRQDLFRQETTQWIHTHVDHKLSKLQFFTRPNDVSCPPAEFKVGLVERFMAGGHNILFTVDDDPDVCTAYNALGIPTFTPPTKCSSLAS